ncbi:MAG: RNA polymerase sigma factor [Saprospiraceae bacterium]|nr:RNA polymerase sigma factor [Saprospiraceae bacterium]
MPYAISMTEAELIAACINNDRLAQKALYDKYSRGMYTTAYRITNDFELAEDVLQEAFVKVFRHIKGFRQESTLGAWIKTIVVRTALSHIKKQPNTDELTSSHTQELIDWGDFLEAEYLEKAIQELPEGYRTVFVLVEVEGYSHKEVAEMLNISIGTSKSQLFHSKKRLRESITKMMNW